MSLDGSVIKRKGISGVIWTIIDRGGQHLIIFLTGIWLARILSPQDYGMIGILSIFTYLGYAFQESGFTAAIVRKEKLVKEDLDVVFYMNVGIGTLSYLILYWGVELIARFYAEPELIPLARVVFLMFLFNAFSVVQNALLVRDMDFRTCTVINTSSMILSYAAALWAALEGWGPYAIAVQIVSFALIRMILLWTNGSWRPGLSFRKKSFDELFSFSFKLLLTNILNTMATRLFPSVIGKAYGTVSAGYYENAQRWGNMPQDFVAGTIANVSFPMISEVQRNETERVREVYRKSVRVTSFIVFPLFLGIMVCARDFIAYVLTEKWLPSVPFIMFICCAGIFNGLNTSNYNMLKAKGRSADILRFEIIRNTMTIIAVLACIPLGVMWMMGAMVAVAVANYLFFSFRVDRMVKIRWMEHIFDIFPYAVLMLVSAAVAYPLSGTFPELHPLLLIAMQLAVMYTIYIGGGYLFGSRIVREIFQILKRQKREA